MVNAQFRTLKLEVDVILVLDEDGVLQEGQKLRVSGAQGSVLKTASFWSRTETFSIM